MSEYVIDATDAQLGDFFDARAFFGPRLKEEIVRCRDCRFYPKRTNAGLPMICWDSGRSMVRSDGFCAWGERRADGAED